METPTTSSSAYRGVLSVEAALVSILLAGLVMGIVDTSFAFRIKHVLQTAAREGARVATTTAGLQPNDPSGKIASVVSQILHEAGVDRNGSSATSVTKTTAADLTPFAVNDPVVVRVTHDYRPFFTGVIPGFSATFHGMLRAASTMRYEGGSGS